MRAMNHSQFLCYALLKIFLKEVLNKDAKEEEKFLCSYFLKTAMFWCIQTDPTYKWSRESFFQGFWKCYMLLLQWVYTGYYPNFFIPQNNLFVCKIVGADQERLFTQMYDLFCSGERCLAKCCGGIQCNAKHRRAPQSGAQIRLEIIIQCLPHGCFKFVKL